MPFRVGWMGQCPVVPSRQHNTSIQISPNPLTGQRLHNQSQLPSTALEYFQKSQLGQKSDLFLELLERSPSNFKSLHNHQARHTGTWWNHLLTMQKTHEGFSESVLVYLEELEQNPLTNSNFPQPFLPKLQSIDPAFLLIYLHTCNQVALPVNWNFVENSQMNWVILLLILNHLKLHKVATPIQNLLQKLFFSSFHQSAVLMSRKDLEMFVSWMPESSFKSFWTNHLILGPAAEYWRKTCHNPTDYFGRFQAALHFDQAISINLALKCIIPRAIIAGNLDLISNTLQELNQSSLQFQTHHGNVFALYLALLNDSELLPFEIIEEIALIKPISPGGPSDRLLADECHPPKHPILVLAALDRILSSCIARSRANLNLLCKIQNILKSLKLSHELQEQLLDALIALEFT